MSKKAAKLSAQPDLAGLFGAWCVSACIAVFTVWQGAYFPVQFLLMLSVFAAAFVLRGKEISASPEVLILLGVSVLYFVSFAILSENRYGGLTESLRTLVFPVSLLFFLNSDKDRSQKSATIGLLIVAVLGLLAYADILPLPGAVITSSNRLQSTIQYANTTALLMIIGTLYSADDFLKRKRITSAICFAVFVLALALTGSRTSLVTALAIGTVYALIKANRRGKLIVCGAVAAATVALVCLTAIPGIRLLRISLYEPTLVERFITYGDALSMLKSKPLLGIGVGNWQTLQYSAQSAPYNVKFIHNYYLQLFLDGGILAPLLFLTSLVPAVVRGVRGRSVHACIILAVMLHAVLDFDLVFASVGVLTMLSLSHLTTRGRTLRVGRLRLIALAPLLVLLTLWTSEALSSRANTQLSRGNLESSMSLNTAALAINPVNTGLYYDMAQSTRDVALTRELLQKAIESNPRDYRSLAMLVRIQAMNGDFGGALDSVERLNFYWRYSEDYQALYREVIQSAVESGYLSDGDAKLRLADIETRSIPQNPLYTLYIDST
jgi:O-antigen ligase